MNKVLLICSFLSICCIHLLALTLKNPKEPIPISKPKYQKVSVQFAQVVKPKPIEKKVKKVVEKKKVFKKPIKKKAKRKLVKKQEVKKKQVKKIEKKVKKKIEKKVAKAIEKAKIKKNVKKVDVKNKASFLKKYKQFKVSYLTKLRSAIDRNKKYPRASIKLREQGRVVVSFRVLNSGIFQNMKILKSSGKKRLDKAALKALQKTSSFYKFDKNINKEFMDITLAIKFKLR